MAIDHLAVSRYQMDPIVCLHSSASTGGQWRSLADHFATRTRVLTPDLYGYGKGSGAKIPSDFTLQDELRWLAPVFDEAGARFHLVRHSYGGLIALVAASEFKERVKSLMVYEPAAWCTAAQVDPTHMGVTEIESVRRETVRLVDRGELEEAAEHFINYWIGKGSWDAMPPKRKAFTTAAMAKVRSEFLADVHAHNVGEISLGTFASIEVPVLYGKLDPCSRRLAKYPCSECATARAVPPGKIAMR